MTPLAYLTRIDDARHMARFYRLDIQPTLFGEWTLVREWGRIGSPGQLRLDPFPTVEAAEAAKSRLEQTKARRGYARQTRSSDAAKAKAFGLFEGSTARAPVKARCALRP